jgi:hypothetical protein
MNPGDPLHPVAEWNLACNLKENYVLLEFGVLTEGQAESALERRIYGLRFDQARALASDIQSQLYRLESGGKPDSLAE